jgi:hypothetical protein
MWDKHLSFLRSGRHGRVRDEKEPDETRMRKSLIWRPFGVGMSAEMNPKVAVVCELLVERQDLEPR